MSDDTKACPVCGETIKVAAIKCRFCSTDLTVFAAERAAEVETMLFAGHPAVIYSAWQWIAVICTLGLGWIYYWLKSLGTSYEITSQRVRIERGIFRRPRTASKYSASITSTCTNHWACAWWATACSICVPRTAASSQ